MTGPRAVTPAQAAARLARVQREYADAARRAIREVDRYGAASARTCAALDRCREAVRMAREAATEDQPNVLPAARNHPDAARV